MATPMLDRITITVHVMSHKRKMGKSRDQIVLKSNEILGETEITHLLRDHYVSDLESMIARAIQDYFEKNPDLEK